MPLLQKGRRKIRLPYTKKGTITKNKLMKKGWVQIKNIKPTRKSKYRMNKIALATSQKALTNWRTKNRRKHKMVFYGSPRKDKKGAYALIQTY